jgi:hypothetical protein
VQLLKKFPAFYRNRRFITVFTRAAHWSLSWAKSIHYYYPFDKTSRRVHYLHALTHIITSCLCFIFTT